MFRPLIIIIIRQFIRRRSMSKVTTRAPLSPVHTKDITATRPHLANKFDFNTLRHDAFDVECSLPLTSV